MRTRGVKALGAALVGALALTACGATSGTTVTGRTPSQSADRAALAAAGPAVSVVAVGDIACPPGKRATATSCRQRATYRTAAALAPTRVIALGDEQYQRGSYYGFTHSYAKSWGNLRKITWPVPGNHEYATAGARGYYRYFKYRTPAGPGYYRRALNGWQLYFLNSNCGAISCATERSWLESQMTAHPASCSMIVFHHPRFSSGAEHGSSRAMKPFWDIAYRHGVTLALSGHDHDYERFAPMTPDGVPDPAKGIRQFVSGGGGRSLYPQGTLVAGSEKFLNTAFGVLQLTLRSNTYDWQFVDTAQQVRDSGTGHC
jgi:alkaline phosphatase